MAHLLTSGARLLARKVRHDKKKTTQIEKIRFQVYRIFDRQGVVSVLEYDSLASATTLSDHFALHFSPTHLRCLLLFHTQAPTVATVATARTVTTLQDTIFAQLPEKQAALGALKKDHGSHV